MHPRAVRTQAGARLDSLPTMAARPRLPVKLRGFRPGAATFQTAVLAIEPPPPRSFKARVESCRRDNGPSTTVQNVAALDSTPNRVCGALGNANVECEDGRYRLADVERRARGCPRRTRPAWSGPARPSAAAGCAEVATPPACRSAPHSCRDDRADAGSDRRGVDRDHARRAPATDRGSLRDVQGRTPRRRALQGRLAISSGAPRVGRPDEQLIQHELVVASGCESRPGAARRPGSKLAARSRTGSGRSFPGSWPGRRAMHAMSPRTRGR